MSPPSYQTIRLSRGRHKSPEDGACVMELASMLSGEPFSDHPASVCPVIAALLRAYNDSVDDARRQHLYPYAATVVGSRASREVERLRAQRLATAAGDQGHPQESRSLWSRLMRAIVTVGAPSPDEVGARAVKRMLKRSDRTHDGVLAFVDELLEIGGVDSRGTVSFPARHHTAA